MSRGKLIVGHLEIFEHTSGTWNVTGMREAIRLEPGTYGPVVCPISPAHVQKLMADGTVDLTKVNLMPPQLDEPIISIFMPDKTLLIVDGNHRYVARWMRGFSMVTSYVFARWMAERFKMSGGGGGG